MLVCPYGEKIDYFTSRGCRFIDLPIDRRGTSIIKDYALMKQYRSIIQTEKPDVVLTYTTKPCVYGGYEWGRLKVPFIVNNAGIMQSSFLLMRVIDILMTFGFRKANCIMCQNDYEKQYITRLLHHKGKYRRIPGSGVNLEQFTFHEYPASDEHIYFNFVALIKKIKGIDEYLECSRRIKTEYPNTHFRIYGEYDSTEYNQKIQDYIEKGYIEYKGVKLDMKPEIESCHAVIHPSYYEGMTNVVLEHSAMGRVCIGSDIPGVADGIEDGVTGYTFPCKNVDALVEKVRKFIELPHEEKAAMGRAARAKMEKEFDRRIVTETYLDEIGKVLKNG
jgi:galacturonosyltransferase